MGQKLKVQDKKDNYLVFKNLNPLVLIKNKDIISHLVNQQIEASFIDRLKIRYRPKICPFGDLLELISPSDTVYDIGCGSGQFLSLVFEFVGCREVYGIEIDNRLINNASVLLRSYNSQNTKIILKTFDGHHFPDDIKNANLIFLIDVLHHVPFISQKDFLVEIFNNMSTNSKLIIKDIDAGSLLVIFNKMHDLIFSNEIGNELTLTSLKDLLLSIGFKNLKISKKRMYVYPHFTITAEKVD